VLLCAAAAVSHDRAFMENCCTQLLELDHAGFTAMHPFGGAGSYDAFKQVSLMPQLSSQLQGVSCSPMAACLTLVITCFGTCQALLMGLFMGCCLLPCTWLVSGTHRHDLSQSQVGSG
jgi:hypothetical protein